MQLTHALGPHLRSWGGTPDVHYWANFQLFGISVLSYGSYPSICGPLVLPLPVKSILLPTLVLSLVLPYNKTLKIKCNQTGLGILMSFQSSITLGTSAILCLHPCCIFQTDMTHGANQNLKPNKADIPCLSTQPAGSVPALCLNNSACAGYRSSECAEVRVFLSCFNKGRAELFWLSLKVTDISG